MKTHDAGRTYRTIVSKLNDLGYGVIDLLLNSSDFGVPQNRVRLYMLGIFNEIPRMSLTSNVGATDSHNFLSTQLDLFGTENCTHTVKDILESSVDKKYFCSNEFIAQLKAVVGEDLSKLDGYRMIDYRGGQSLHSWELGKKG